ncbi:tetratricopeptide repeat protein [Streptomyces tsukubensis]|uniref:tetratricopeptide repeat protein n=1 Tax=Streptomyces tsukubensis TaxID=83656 RepID=UPI00367EE5D3
MKRDTIAAPVDPPKSSTGAQHSEVPPLNPRFQGRNATLIGLEQRVHRDPMGVTVLLGPFGVGKTQIAVEYVHRSTAYFGFVRWIRARSGPLDNGHVIADMADESGGARATLVVIDGLCSPTELERYRPNGFDGHVLITATGRAADWQPWARVVIVEPWGQAEAIAYLQASVRRLSTEDAGRIADTVGYLPLALAYAVDFLNRPVTPNEFLHALRHRPRVVLGGAGPDCYQGSLIERFEQARGRLEEFDHWHARLLDAAAMLGPVPFPTRAIRPGVLCRSTVSAPGSEFVLHTESLVRAFPELAKTGMASLDQGVLSVSPVYCAAVRGFLSHEAKARAVEWADHLLMALGPRRVVPDRRRRQDQWQPVLPSFLARNPNEVVTYEGLSALGAAYEHMVGIGRWHAVLKSLELLQLRARDLLPEENSTAMGINDTLLHAYSGAHFHAKAVRLGSDLLIRRRAKYGDMDLVALRYASSMIIPLAGCGAFPAAVERAEETLVAQYALLGSDHPSTMLTSSRRAVVELMAGRWQNSVSMGNATLERQRSILGPQHPDALATAYALGRAYDKSVIHALEAVSLLADTVHSQEDVLGDTHPATIRTAVAFELAHFRAHDVLHDLERCRLLLERLSQEFGADDWDVVRLDQIVHGQKAGRSPL